MLAAGELVERALGDRARLLGGVGDAVGDQELRAAEAARLVARLGRRGEVVAREAEDDVWSLTERERKALGISPLPRSLWDAIGIAEDSELLAETLGEHVFDFFLRNKRAEWDDYRGQVSAYERERMLPVI